MLCFTLKTKNSQMWTFLISAVLNDEKAWDTLLLENMGNNFETFKQCIQNSSSLKKKTTKKTQIYIYIYILYETFWQRLLAQRPHIQWGGASRRKAILRIRSPKFIFPFQYEPEYPRTPAPTPITPTHHMLQGIHIIKEAPMGEMKAVVSISFGWHVSIAD